MGWGVVGQLDEPGMVLATKGCSSRRMANMERWIDEHLRHWISPKDPLIMFSDPCTHVRVEWIALVGVICKCM